MRYSYEAFEADVLLNDSDNLEQFGFRRKVASLRGHTNCSIGIEVNEDFFVGDAVMKMNGKLIVLIFGDFDVLMMRNLPRINMHNNDRIYTGH